METHTASSCKLTVQRSKSKPGSLLRSQVQPRSLLGALVIAWGSVACGPHAHIPPRPVAPLALATQDDKAALVARRLAPTLYIQRDEWFPLSRVVAVVHPTLPLVAYHLLWRDDAYGAWLPFTRPTDQEVVWVAYDTASGEPSSLYTYWHGKVLHTDWRGRGQPAVDIQWGKHGSMPHDVTQSDLPSMQSLNIFYAFTWLGVPDLLLGRIVRKGPVCFCHSYERYREFTRVVPLGDRLDAVVVTGRPDAELRAVFGRDYSHKNAWPPKLSDLEPGIPRRVSAQ